MTRGYREGSRMSKTLDYLVGQGIDCIKIADPKKGRAPKTIFLPIKINGEGDITDILNRVEGMTKYNIKIEVDFLSGYEIEKLNPKFKLKDEELYDVIKITYFPYFKINKIGDNFFYNYP